MAETSAPETRSLREAEETCRRPQETAPQLDQRNQNAQRQTLSLLEDDGHGRDTLQGAREPETGVPSEGSSHEESPPLKWRRAWLPKSRWFLHKETRAVVTETWGLCRGLETPLHVQVTLVSSWLAGGGLPVPVERREKEKWWNWGAGVG